MTVLFQHRSPGVLLLINDSPSTGSSRQEVDQDRQEVDQDKQGIDQEGQEIDLDGQVVAY